MTRHRRAADAAQLAQVGVRQRTRSLVRNEFLLRQSTAKIGCKGADDTEALTRAREAAGIANEILVWVDKPENGPLVRSVRRGPDYARYVGNLRDPVRRLSGYVTAAKRDGYADKIEPGLRRVMIELVESLERVVAVIRSGLADLPSTSDGFGRALQETEEFAERLASVGVLAQVAAAATVDHTDRDMAEEFAALSREESWKATACRWGGIATLGAITLVTYLIVFHTPLPTASVHGDIARLSITVPLAALAAYLGRESSRHRDRGERAHDLGLHLRHLGTFSGPLGEDDARRYRFELGQRAWPPQDPPAATDPVAGVAEELARLTEVLRGRAGIDGVAEIPGQPKE